MQEIALAKELRVKRGFIACHEVSNYGCRADVLAVDKRKQIIYEYEFKRNSLDLKVCELRKSKYGKETHYKWITDKTGRHHSCKVKTDFPQPNYFYFVMPMELWQKEIIYLRSLKVGVMTFDEKSEFYVQKRCPKNMSNVFKYHVVEQNIFIRLANWYVWNDTLNPTVS
jgi:hypothetical protein